MRNAMVVVVLSLFARPACADVIDSTWTPPRCPTLECLAGSSAAPSGSHSGCSPGCGPRPECESDADCGPLGEGARCVETRFCIGEGFAARLGPTPIVHGECADDGSCAEGECSVTRRCAAAPPPPPPPSTPREPAGSEEEVVVEGPASDEGEGAGEAAPSEPESSEPDSRGGGCVVGVGRSGDGDGWSLALVALFVLAARRRRGGRVRGCAE